MKQIKFLLIIAISALAAACSDEEAPKEPTIKEQIIGKWTLTNISDFYSKEEAPKEIILSFSETTLTYVKGYESSDVAEGESSKLERQGYRFPYTFTNQNNNINISHSNVLAYYESEGWGKYAPENLLTPEEKTEGTAVVSVPGWADAGSISDYKVIGYGVKYATSAGVQYARFHESFSQNWKVIEIETKGKGKLKEKTMILETARLNKAGEARIAVEEYKYLVEEETGTPGVEDIPGFDIGSLW
jgi:hypothetical protein